MINVDKDKCIGCGLCAGLCPDKFQMDLDGKAVAISQEADNCATNAAENCPVNAISAE